ncbi:MAG: hypothetical protein J3K34DRAFT_472525 [Monoraphidium minutum]|nr:MAG: hypothetical protein J3K34DRAFT_472525 [Monoraphidium minutum]
MGNALCLSREKPPKAVLATAARVSPIPAFRKRRRSSGEGAPPTLQDLCVASVAGAAARLDISVLPSELIQRVADHLIDEGKLDLALLPHALTPWTDALSLSRLEGVGDAWLARAAVCHGLRVLDITNCNLITGGGVLALAHLQGLVVLRASNCHQIGDEAMAELRLDGCEAITDAGAGRLAALANLKALSLAKCAALGPAALAALGGLTSLRELDLGWCRGVGAPAASGGARGAAAPAPHPQQQLPPAPSAAGAYAAAAAAALPAALGAAAAAAAAGASQPAGRPQQLALEPPGPSGPLAPLARLRGLTALNLCSTRVGDNALPPLAALTALTSLDLSGNPKVSMRGLAAAILGLDPPPPPPPRGPRAAAAAGGAAAGCFKLARLRLRDCGVPDGGAGFAELSSALAPALRSLDLSCTRAGSRALTQIAGLTGLTELLLDMCPAFSSLTNLEHLDLSDTEVGTPGAFHLARLRRLSRLALSDTDAGDGAVSALTGLTRLTALHLDARHVSDEALRLALPLAGTLRELDLYGCKVTLRGAAALPAYRELTHLFLCGGWLTDRAVMEVAKLAKLQHLSIAQNPRLTDAAVHALSGGACAGSLEALNLTGTSVTDACLPLLARMPALAVVALSNTRVTRGAADELRRATKLLVKFAAPGGAAAGAAAPGGGA